MTTKKSHTPKISIVLPCYNGAEMLHRAIESVINQTFTDWELLIVNDCSTDNTAEIGALYASKDSRIRLTNNEKNLKLPATLNVGFRKAKGDYFTWTSDDNILHPNMLEKLYTCLEANPNVGMAVSGFEIIDEKGNLVETIVPKDIQQRLPLNNYVGASFLYRKEVAHTVGEYDTTLFLVEDYDYWIRIWEKFSIETVNEVLYTYSIHSNSLTANNRERIEERLLHLRLKYFDVFEQYLANAPAKLIQFYTRIVDVSKGADKWKRYWQYARSFPRFGLKYVVIHIPHRKLKNIKKKFKRTK